MLSTTSHQAAAKQWNVNAKEFTPIAAGSTSLGVLSKQKAATTSAATSGTTTPNTSFELENHLNHFGSDNFASLQNSSTYLRVEAPVFVPRVQVHAEESIAAQIREVVLDASLKGIKVKEIPKEYAFRFNKPLDLSQVSAADLSVLLKTSLSDSLYLEDAAPSFGSINEAMAAAGFKLGLADSATANHVVDAAIDRLDGLSSELSSELTSTLCPIGRDGEKYARHVNFKNYLPDLLAFKQSVINVVSNFCTKASVASDLFAKQSGLALSLFAAEWERYHLVRMERKLVDLKLLRERFGASKLMPFLQAIPELEVVGIHPEVRVRTKPGVVFRGPKSPLLGPSVLRPTAKVSPNVSLLSDSVPVSRSTISLNSELFGDEEPPMTSEDQTRAVLEEMLSQSQGQILTILSSVPADPIQAAAAVEKVNELQVLVNALKAALAVLPPKQVVPQKRTTISLNSMLNLEEPPSISAAAGAGAGVGQLLADLSRILLTQVTQPEAANESTAALERTLADIVSAASTPPGSPVGEGSLIIPRSLPTSPIDPVGPLHFSGASTPPTLSLSSALGLSDDSTVPGVTPNEISAMDQLLRGLAPAANTVIPVVAAEKQEPPVRVKGAAVMNSNANRRIVGKAELLAVMRNLREKELFAGPPKELAGLSCRQAAPRVSRKHAPEDNVSF